MEEKRTKRGSAQTNSMVLSMRRGRETYTPEEKGSVRGCGRTCEALIALIFTQRIVCVLSASSEPP